MLQAFLCASYRPYPTFQRVGLALPAVKKPCAFLFLLPPPPYLFPASLETQMDSLIDQRVT